MNTLAFLPIYTVLSIVGFLDHKTYRIPNIYVLIIIIYSIFCAFFGTEIHIFSAFFLILLGVVMPLIMSRILKRQILLGGGDIKLMGACALFLPPENLGLFLILTGVSGLLHRSIFKKDPIPFAPAIGIAFFLTTL